MDRDKFTPGMTGELVPIATPHGRDWAFIPEPFPLNWVLPNELSELLGDAREQLGTLNGIGRTLNNPTLLLRPLQQREALRSSSLEGTFATPMELLRYELNPKEPTSEHDRRNAWREVHNHNRALLHGFGRLDEIALTKRLMREMHAVLMEGVRGRDKRPGEFRDRQVHVGSDRRYIPPPAEHLGACLDDFEGALHNTTHKINPLVFAYIAHYQFEAIHPFHDGNGRIGRVMLSLTTCEWHGHSMPWLYMSAFFDEYKDEYINKLFQVSARGDWAGWIEFCLRGTVEQCQDAIRRCEALGALRDQLHGNADGLSHRMHLIVDKLFDFPVFRVVDIQTWNNISRPTAQADVNKLIDRGIVRYLEGEKPKTYFAPSILDVAYGDIPSPNVDRSKQMEMFG